MSRSYYCNTFAVFVYPTIAVIVIVRLDIKGK